jgi:hypothetical protein
MSLSLQVALPLAVACVAISVFLVIWALRLEHRRTPSSSGTSQTKLGWGRVGFESDSLVFIVLVAALALGVGVVGLTPLVLHVVSSTAKSSRVQPNHAGTALTQQPNHAGTAPTQVGDATIARVNNSFGAEIRTEPVWLPGQKTDQGNIVGGVGYRDTIKVRCRTRGKGQTTPLTWWLRKDAELGSPAGYVAENLTDLRDANVQPRSCWYGVVKTSDGSSVYVRLTPGGADIGGGVSSGTPVVMRCWATGRYKDRMIRWILIEKSVDDRAGYVAGGEIDAHPELPMNEVPRCWPGAGP